jgi:hypothetical protein
LEDDIEAISETEYLSRRVDDQIDWYDRRSKFNQRSYKYLSLLEVALAGFIPLLVGHVSILSTEYKWIIGGFGLAISILSAMTAIYKFQENWISYRSTAEMLKHEKYFYLTRSSPYDGSDSFDLFVKRIEVVISSENSNWVKNFNRSSKEK